VFSDHNGDVFRRLPGGSWQLHDGSGWAPPQAQPALDRDFAARQRGAARFDGRAGAAPSEGGKRP